MIDGILLIDKSEGITSYDVIRILKKHFPKEQKIGHAGTLDPFATGLLVILLGRATKLMDQFNTLSKEYVVKGKLGISTDTYDLTGKEIDSSDIHPTKNDIEVCIKNSFLGDIQQIPPKYSAKKIKGRKAYDLAREGKEFEIKPKSVSVYTYDLLQYDYPYIDCLIKCSSGTYVRSLINDLGVKLGCYGTTWSLRRVSIGNLNVKEAFKVEEYSPLSIINLDSIKL